MENCFSHLEYGDGRPQDVVEVFSVALADRVLRDDHLARATLYFP